MFRAILIDKDAAGYRAGLQHLDEARLPEGDGTLSGISGGPVFSTDGRVVGINSASTDRRGRILTVAPDAMMPTVTAGLR